MIEIGFNKPYFSGDETKYIKDAILVEKRISGNGKYTEKCQKFFIDRYKFKNCFLTTSCTDALEMAALLINIHPGDEVIMPSFTFVSTANAFVLRGAKIVFVDSNKNEPNIDTLKIEKAITINTKAIVVVHYAGVSVNMDIVMRIATKYNLYVIEDAAQAIDAYHNNIPLGSIGHLATFSFHETKNIISGEGGLLVINDNNFLKRAEIIWEKGTNRAAFFKGEVDKYGWVDIGSSFLPSEIIAAFLYAQLENIDEIQEKRKKHWKNYYENLLELEKSGFIKLPIIPKYSSNNAHIFYIICNLKKDRKELIRFLDSKKITSVFHYQSLHSSAFYKDKSENIELEMSDYYSDHLLRLPMYFELENRQINFITDAIKEFFIGNTQT